MMMTKSPNVERPWRTRRDVVLAPGPNQSTSAVTITIAVLITNAGPSIGSRQKTLRLFLVRGVLQEQQSVYLLRKNT